MVSKRDSRRQTPTNRSTSRSTRSSSSSRDVRASSRPSSRSAARPTSRQSNRQNTRSYNRSSTPRPVRVSSVTVGEAAQRSRNQRMQETHRRYIIRLGVTVGIIVALILGAVGVYYSPVFSITEVRVDGAEHLTAEEMSAIAAVPENTTLLRVDAKTIRSNIMRDAWVKNVDVNREFPHTLGLAVTERDVAATVSVSINDGEDTELWALAEDGMWLCPLPPKDSPEAKGVSPKIYEDVEKVFSITDVP